MIKLEIPCSTKGCLETREYTDYGIMMVKKLHKKPKCYQCWRKERNRKALVYSHKLSTARKSKNGKLKRVQLLVKPKFYGKQTKEVV